MVAGLPIRRPMGGADYFLLAVDRSMRKNTATSNLCYFVLRVDGVVSSDDIRSRVESAEYCRWLLSLRWARRWPMGLPRWRAVKTESSVVLREHEGSLDDPSSYFPTLLDPRRDCLFEVDVVRCDEQSLVIFTWHHSLMDAHGAERLFAYIAGRAEIPAAEDLLGGAADDRPILGRLLQARNVKEWLEELNAEPVTLLPPQGEMSDARTVYRRIAFTSDETQAIDAAAVAAGAGFLKSAFYLGATLRSLKSLLEARGVYEGHNWLIPVPLDLRKRGASGPLFGNCVTFFFYLLRSSETESVEVIVKRISEQMQQTMRSGILEDYSSFMRLCRRLPLPFYGRLLESPTRGSFASFFFSDTGDSLNRCDEFLGSPVVSAAHYPPNTMPPGFTVVLSRFKGALQATVAYFDHLLSADDFAAFEESFRRELQVATASTESP